MIRTSETLTRSSFAYCRAALVCLALLEIPQFSQGQDPAIRFAEPQQLECGDEPRAVVAGDINGDSHVDLIAANYGRRDLSVLLNDGQGGFQRELPLACRLAAGRRAPTRLELKDLDGDGDLDLAILTDSPAGGLDCLSVLRNTGSGWFGNLTQYRSREQRFAGVQAIDADGDSDLDLLLTSPVGGGGNWLHVNVGRGVFGPIKAWPSASSQHRADLDAFCLLDLDQDQQTDCIAVGEGNAMQVWPGPVLGRAERPRQLDLRGLGFRNDAVPVGAIAAHRQVASTTHVVIITKDTSAKATYRFAATNLGESQSVAQWIEDAPEMRSVQFVRLIDLNTDTLPELVIVGNTANGQDRQFVVLSGRPDGGYERSASFDLPIAHHGIAISDLNADKRPDLIVPDMDQSLLVYMNTSPPAVPPAPQIARKSPAQPPKKQSQPSPDDDPREQREPAEDGQPSEQREPTEDGKPREQREPAEDGKPRERREPAEDGKPREQREPAEDGKPREQREPAEDGNPREQREPAEDGKPREQREPAEDGKPREQGKPAEHGTPREKGKPSEPYRDKRNLERPADENEEPSDERRDSEQQRRPSDRQPQREPTPAPKDGQEDRAPQRKPAEGEKQDERPSPPRDQREEGQPRPDETPPKRKRVPNLPDGTPPSQPAPDSPGEPRKPAPSPQPQGQKDAPPKQQQEDTAEPFSPVEGQVPRPRRIPTRRWWPRD